MNEDTKKIVIFFVVGAVVISIIVFLIRFAQKGLIVKGQTASNDVYVGTNPYGRVGGGTSPNNAPDQPELDRIKIEKLAEKQKMLLNNKTNTDSGYTMQEEQRNLIYRHNIGLFV